MREMLGKVRGVCSGGSPELISKGQGQAKIKSKAGTVLHQLVTIGKQRVLSVDSAQTPNENIQSACNDMEGDMGV